MTKKRHLQVRMAINAAGVAFSAYAMCSMLIISNNIVGAVIMAVCLFMNASLLSRNHNEYKSIKDEDSKS